MINITEKKNCCGCTACYCVCPVSAISMVADNEGFFYPQIDITKCINCGKCEKVCPIRKPSADNNRFSRKGAIVRSNNIEVLMDSTSGGFFTPVAEHIIKAGGEVYAVTYDKTFSVVHEVCKDIPDIPRFRGSKYVQSNLDDTFKLIKYRLDQGITIGFFGTTCQVYGLKSFLGKDYSNLYTIDLVCHGTPSPKLWEKYLKYQEKVNGSKIKNINFRSKKYGYHVASMTIDFENGHQYCASARTDLMLKCFFSEICSRPSCYDCHFKILERVSDITIFDSWHAGEISKEIRDDDKGYTNIIIQNQKGYDLLRAIEENVSVYWINIEDAVNLDGPMIRNSAIPNAKRNMFYESIDSRDIREHINSFLPITMKDVAIDRFKSCFYRFGILKMIKKLRGN